MFIIDVKKYPGYFLKVSHISLMFLKVSNKAPHVSTSIVNNLDDIRSKNLKFE